MEKVIYLISFLVALSNYVVSISIPLYLISKFSASPFILGMAGFFGNFAYTIFAYISYKLKWKIHFPWFVISSLLISFAYFLLPFFPFYTLFFLLLFINGIFFSRFWPSLQYFFSSKSGSIDKYNLSWTSGVLFGIFISGYLFKIKELLPFFLGGFLAFVSFILGYINFKKFIVVYRNLPEKFTNSSDKKIDKETFKILTLNFVNFLGFGGMMYLFPKLGKTIGYSPSLISNIFTFMFGIRFLMFYLFSKIKIKTEEKTIFFSYLAICLSLIFTGISRKPLFHILSISLLGITASFSYRTSIINVIEKGYSTELNEAIIGLGFLTGSLIVGSLSQIFGIFNGFIFSGITILLIFLIQKYLLK